MAQRPGAHAAHGQLRVRMAGLCYDTPSGEAMPFPVDTPDKPPCALIEAAVIVAQLVGMKLAQAVKPKG